MITFDLFTESPYKANRLPEMSEQLTLNKAFSVLKDHIPNILMQQPSRQNKMFTFEYNSLKDSIDNVPPEDVYNWLRKYVASDVELIHDKSGTQVDHIKYIMYGSDLYEGTESETELERVEDWLHSDSEMSQAQVYHLEEFIKKNGIHSIANSLLNYIDRHSDEGLEEVLASITDPFFLLDYAITRNKEASPEAVAGALHSRLSPNRRFTFIGYMQQFFQNKRWPAFEEALLEGYTLMNVGRLATYMLDRADLEEPPDNLKPVLLKEIQKIVQGVSKGDATYRGLMIFDKAIDYAAKTGKPWPELEQLIKDSDEVSEGFSKQFYKRYLQKVLIPFQKGLNVFDSEDTLGAALSIFEGKETKEPKEPEVVVSEKKEEPVLIVEEVLPPLKDLFEMARPIIKLPLEGPKLRLDQAVKIIEPYFEYLHLTIARKVIIKYGGRDTGLQLDHVADFFRRRVNPKAEIRRPGGMSSNTYAMPIETMYKPLPMEFIKQIPRLLKSKVKLPRATTKKVGKIMTDYRLWLKYGDKIRDYMERTKDVWPELSHVFNNEQMMGRFAIAVLGKKLGPKAELTWLTRKGKTWEEMVDGPMYSPPGIDHPYNGVDYAKAFYPNGWPAFEKLPFRKIHGNLAYDYMQFVGRIPLAWAGDVFNAVLAKFVHSEDRNMVEMHNFLKKYDLDKSFQSLMPETISGSTSYTYNRPSLINFYINYIMSHPYIDDNTRKALAIQLINSINEKSEFAQAYDYKATMGTLHGKIIELVKYVGDSPEIGEALKGIPDIHNRYVQEVKSKQKDYNAFDDPNDLGALLDVFS